MQIIFDIVSPPSQSSSNPNALLLTDGLYVHRICEPCRKLFIPADAYSDRQDLPPGYVSSQITRTL